MPSLDTNCLLRWFLADVPEQKAKVDHLFATESHLRVFDAAIIETIFALERGLGVSRTVAAQAIKELAAQRNVMMDRPVWAAVLETWQAKPKCSIVDVYLAVRANQTGATPLYSFDRKMTLQLDGVKPPPPVPPRRRG